MDAKLRYESFTLDFEQAQRECPHEWDHPEGTSDPIVRPGYRIEEFKAGSDFYPGGWVPEERTPRWVRKCTRCGKREETTAVNTRTVQTPRF